jgi:NB-ARC domain
LPIVHAHAVASANHHLEHIHGFVLHRVVQWPHELIASMQNVSGHKWAHALQACQALTGAMEHAVGTDWALGEAADQVVAWTAHVVHCKQQCAALAWALGAGGRLRGTVCNLDELIQEEAFNDVRRLHGSLCEHLEEAQYVMLRCQQTSGWSILARMSMRRRIDAVQSALQGIASQSSCIAVRAALQLDHDIRDQRERDAAAAEEQAPLLHQQEHLPADPVRGRMRTPSLRSSAMPPVIFQHLDDLVPELCAELLLHRVHGVVGMAGIGKTTVAAAVYAQAESSFHKHYFLTVGVAVDALELLRSVFQSLKPGMQC